MGSGLHGVRLSREDDVHMTDMYDIAEDMDSDYSGYENKPLRIYECTLSSRKGGSFEFVIVAHNLYEAKNIAQKYKRMYGYTRVEELKFSAVNNGKTYQDIPNKVGGY